MTTKHAGPLLQENLTHSAVGSFFEVHRELFGTITEIPPRVLREPPGIIAQRVKDGSTGEMESILVTRIREDRYQPRIKADARNPGVVRDGRRSRQQCVDCGLGPKKSSVAIAGDER